MQLEGRVALVTGGGRRIGRALAVALGRKGMVVAVHYHASRSGADQAVEEIADSGGRAAAFSADLTQPDAPARLIEAVRSSLGRPAVLVNSAAVMERTPFGRTTHNEWDAILALNLRAPFFLAQAASADLKAEHGCIVNISDLAAFETWPGYLPHGVSKAGLVYLTRALARVLAPEVRVNGIAPGTVLLPDGFDPGEAERLRETTPLERHGSPGDVVTALEYLLQADYVTGETIVVDGGRHARV